MNQSISKFGHFDQALAKKIINNANPFHADKNVCIGYGCINRLLTGKARSTDFRYLNSVQ